MTTFRKIKISGETFDVSVRDDGRFIADLGGGDAIAHVTLEGLKKLLTQHAKGGAKAVSVEASFIRTDHSDLEYAPIVLTGIHSGSDNVIYRDRHGKVAQIRANFDIYRRLTSKELAEGKRLSLDVARATEALEGWAREKLIFAREVILAARLKAREKKAAGR